MLEAVGGGGGMYVGSEAGAGRHADASSELRRAREESDGWGVEGVARWRRRAPLRAQAGERGESGREGEGATALCLARSSGACEIEGGRGGGYSGDWFEPSRE